MVFLVNIRAVIHDNLTDTMVPFWSIASQCYLLLDIHALIPSQRLWKLVWKVSCRIGSTQLLQVNEGVSPAESTTIYVHILLLSKISSTLWILGSCPCKDGWILDVWYSSAIIIEQVPSVLLVQRWLLDGVVVGKFAYPRVAWRLPHPLFWIFRLLLIARVTWSDWLDII